MSDEKTSPDPKAQVVSLDERRQVALETERPDDQPTEGELILLHEGLDLLAAFKRIPDPKMRDLVRALAEAFAEAASKKDV